MMKKSKKLLSLLLCLALVLSMCALGLTACDDNNSPSGVNPKGGLITSSKSITVEIDKGTTISCKEYVQWSIEDPTVATITPTIADKNNPGYYRMCAVLGVKAGSTTVTATSASGKTDKATVTVTEKNVVTIKSNDGTVVTGGTVNLEKGNTLQLSASTNLGSKKFKWKSSDSQTASVSSAGLVKGENAGKATITVSVDGDEQTYAEVTVNVTAAAGHTEYFLLMGEEGGTKAWNEENQAFDGEDLKEDTYFYWAARAGWDQQEVTFINKPQYSDGKISFNYTSNWNPGYWYGLQILYKNSSHTVGNTYKLNAKINIKSASLINKDGSTENLNEMKVTLNDNVITLKKGINEVEIYYVYTAPFANGGTSSFDLVMGWPDPSNGTGWFVQNADVEVTDITWTPDAPIKLKAPTFTYENDKLSVEDPNTEGVNGYRANFYQGDKQVSSSLVNDGEAFNTNALDKGTYTVKIQAVALNAHYLDSEESSTEVEIEVSADPSYTIPAGADREALDTPGRWSYYAGAWVVINEATYDAGTVTFSFGNNKGNWDVLQLFYKNPTNVAGKTYKLTVDIDLKDNEDGGYVLLSDNEIFLKPGKHTYELAYTEKAGSASFAFFGALYNQPGTLPNGTLVISNYSWTDITGAAPSPLDTPSAPTVSVEDATATVTFEANVKGASKGYDIGFFTSATGETPSLTASATEGKVEVSLELLSSGTYYVRIRAKGDGILYAAHSAWSTASASFNYTNESGDVYQLPNDGNTSASAYPGKWAYYTHSWVSTQGKTPYHDNDGAHLSFSNNAGDFWVVQLAILPEGTTSGQTYEISFTITVENALITNDGNGGGEGYNPADHAIETDTFMITIGDQKQEIQTGTHTYTFTITVNGAIEFDFGINQDGDYHRLSSADITIGDPVVTAK
ncbi:MAG: Ig-like domain-containing protein [Clostridiales bacterium]|nr:Ig-like domain-containing protein [Clostridiales bacterium]